MKKIFLTILIITAIALTFNSLVSAQELPENTIESAVTNLEATPTPAPQTQLQTGQVTNTQKTSRSNMSCVAIGSAPAEKPAICTQPAQTDSGGFIGPIAGEGPTLEPCGQASNGQTIVCIKPAYVFYCQGDPRWGSTCDMARAGCGPTSMAMILSSYGDTILPIDMDKMFQKRGWRQCGDEPSYMQSAVQTLLPEMGYEYHALGAPLNLPRVQEYLDAGYLIIGSTFGHIFVIDGVNIENSTVRLRDPGRCENAGGVIRSARTPWGGQSLMYAYAIKKKPVQQ